jgi:hypothetical protein
MIFDNELLPEPFREPLSGKSCDDVVYAAGRIAHKNARRP